MWQRIILIVGTVLGLTNAISAAGESSKAGEHFRVVCHFDGDEIVSAALKTAEAVWPVADELFGIKAAAPKSPLEIHLYRNAADYERAESALTGGRFKANLAFLQEGANAAHVAVQPDCTDATLQAVGLNAQTRRLIAHEAAHLYRFANIPNHGDHPEWLSAGASSWIADEIMRAGGYSAGAEADPFTATYMVWAQQLAEQGHWPPVDSILRDELSDINSNTRYGLRWLLFRFMLSGSHSGAWKQVLAEARRLGGGADYVSRLHDGVVKVLGADALARLDEEFKSYALALKPQWEQVFRSLEQRDKIAVQMAFPDSNAVAWRTKPVGRDEYSLAGSFQILPGGRQQLNVLLGRSADGFVSVAFVAGYGVTVFEYHAQKDEAWERLGDIKIDGVELSRWVPFRVDVRDGHLEVTIGDRSVLTVALRGRPVNGAWGLGAQAGSAGQWRDIKLGR